MGQTREAITPTLAERLCWQAPQRDAVRVVRRLYRKGMVDGVYRLDEGALLDDFFHFLRELGVLDVMEGVQGAALQREMVPVVQYLFAGHHQPLRVWILCLHLMGLNLSNYQIAQELDLNKDAVQQMTCQLRQGIVTKKPIPTLTAEVG